MKKKILLTLNQPLEAFPSGKYPRNTLEYLVDQGNVVNVADWTNILPDGTVREAYDLEDQTTYQGLELNRNFDLVHLLQLGPIHDRLEQFRSVLESLKEFNGIVVNPPETMIYGLDKGYLMMLQEAGFPVPKTVVYKAEDVDAITDEHDPSSVVKPIDGEQGKLVLRVSELDSDSIRQYKNNGKDVLVQEFVKDINKGERSLIYLNRKFSHAAIKVPESDFRVNWEFGTSITSYVPSNAEMMLGCRILEGWPHNTPVMRVDLAGTTHNPVIMEVETVNPAMYAESTNVGISLGQKLDVAYDELIQDHISDRGS